MNNVIQELNARYLNAFKQMSLGEGAYSLIMRVLEKSLEVTDNYMDELSFEENADDQDLQLLLYHRLLLQECKNKMRKNQDKLRGARPNHSDHRNVYTVAELLSIRLMSCYWSLLEDELLHALVHPADLVKE